MPVNGVGLCIDDDVLRPFCRVVVQRRKKKVEKVPKSRDTHGRVVVIIMFSRSTYYLRTDAPSKFFSHDE